MGTIPYGLTGLLKEGYKLYSGINDVVQKNIDACKELSQITKTSIGPNGMSKIVINHLDKLFVTSDSNTIISELDVYHPAAKLIVMAAKAQQQEMGDGTNIVLSIAGELLNLAESLLQDGLHVSEVADGYKKASKKALESLENLVIPGSDVCDVKDHTKITELLKSSVSSKQSGFESILCPLVSQACINVCPKNPVNFNVDNVRVCKIIGGSLSASTVVKGMVFKREAEGVIKRIENAKVAVFSQGVDTSSTETKGTVLITSAEQLESYSTSEEAKLEAYVKGIVETGARVVVSGSSIGEMAMHFLDKYEIMVLKLTSKFELRRFCRATNATALSAFKVPDQDQLGFVKEMFVEEMGDTECVIVKQSSDVECEVSTIVLRGSTQSILDDIEHAVDNAVNNYRIICKDSRTLPGAGACEIELGRILADYGRKQTGLDQYSIAKFAEALEIVPRMLAETSGFNATDVVSAVQAAHSTGDTMIGIDVQNGTPKDMTKERIYDLFQTKWWGLKLATDAVVTVLKVDQIIVARQAGGPKPRGQQSGWDDQD
eukprot:g5920.t1